jgi:putative membrane protein insertion efficiency factor
LCSQNNDINHQTATRIKTILSFPFIVLIKLYQWVISPMLGPKCRFTPTCSQYALQAFKKYGPLKGFWLSLRRISKCHPWGGHGYDPVP